MNTLGLYQIYRCVQGTNRGDVKIYRFFPQIIYEVLQLRAPIFVILDQVIIAASNRTVGNANEYIVVGFERALCDQVTRPGLSTIKRVRRR